MEVQGCRAALLLCHSFSEVPADSCSHLVDSGMIAHRVEQPLRTSSTAPWHEHPVGKGQFSHGALPMVPGPLTNLLQQSTTAWLRLALPEPLKQSLVARSVEGEKFGYKFSCARLATLLLLRRSRRARCARDVLCSTCFRAARLCTQRAGFLSRPLPRIVVSFSRNNRSQVPCRLGLFTAQYLRDP